MNVKRCVRAKGVAKRAALGTLQALWLRERPVCAPSVPEGFGGASRSNARNAADRRLKQGAFEIKQLLTTAGAPETVASSTFLASRYLLQAIRPHANFVPRRVVRYFVGTYRSCFCRGGPTRLNSLNTAQVVLCACRQVS